jgi:succinoglycan biosynthesis transport protein ExoP
MKEPIMASEFHLHGSELLPSEQDQEGGLRLDRFVAALRRHVLLIVGVTTLTASAAVLKAVTDDPTYQSSVELLTPQASLETKIISTLNPSALSNQEDLVNVGVDETKLKILTSPRVMGPVVAELQTSYPEITYSSLAGSLRITPGAEGDTLLVSFQAENPEKVTKVLEAVSEAYLRYSLQDRQSDIYRGIDFVDEQLPIVRERVNELEAELEILRQKANLIDPLVTGQQLTQQLARFSAEQLDVRVQIEQAQQLYQNLQQELAEGEEMATNSALLDNERYQTLLNQLLEIDSQLAEDLTLYLEDSPEIEVIEERRDNLQPLLVREGSRALEQLENYILELQNRDRALSDIIQTLNQGNERLSTVTRQYNDIQRELGIATENLNQFLTKREALRIDAAQRQTPWEILTPPATPIASAASAKRNLVLGTVLGLLLGSGAAILVDRMSGKIHTIKELKEAAPVPLLGRIPYNPILESGQSLALSMSQIADMGFDFDLPTGTSINQEQTEASTPFLESFRSLATSIRLSRPDNPIKSFVVSSAIPNAGKSTISFHLAHAFAAMGQRTLIIDTDLRRPSLHKFCNSTNVKGLSNYSTGEFDVEDIIVDLPIDENLFFVPAGPVPPNPVQTLTSRRMEEFLIHIYETFDMVIFDTPPIIGFADSLIMARKTHGLLLAARLGQVKFSQLQAALDELLIAKVPVIGMVANVSKQEKDTAYSYYQYYQQPPEVPVELMNGSGSYGKNHQASWYEPLVNPVNKYFGKKR